MTLMKLFPLANQKLKNLNKQLLNSLIPRSHFQFAHFIIYQTVFSVSVVDTGEGTRIPSPPPTFLDHTEAYCLAAFAFKLKLLVHSTYTQLFETPINITPAPPQYHQTFKLVGKWEVLVGI